MTIYGNVDWDVDRSAGAKVFKGDNGGLSIFVGAEVWWSCC